jgi:nucleoside-diphosphate-sugar epimerase
MNIFVTGGTGFIGKHFLRLAIEHGNRITALHRNQIPSAIQHLPEITWVKAQLDAVPESALSGCDTLVHFAAHGVTEPTKATWDDCFKWNVTAALKLWQVAAHAGVRRFVLCGSCFEYGRSAERYDYIPPTAPLEPTGPYHASKAAATVAALGFAADFGKEVIVLRPFHVFGEGEAANRFWPSLRQAARSGADFEMTSGEQIRDFVSVNTVVEKFWHGCTRSIDAGFPIVENIGGDKPRSIREFAELVWSQEKAKGKLILGALPYRNNEVMRYVGEAP